MTPAAAAPDRDRDASSDHAASAPAAAADGGGRVDLHAHTTVSDGTTPPRDLVAMAQKAGLRALAVTDHDHVGALPEAMAAGRELGVEVIPGVEFSIQHGDHSFHMLAYLFDPEDGPLNAALTRVQEYRANRNPKIIQKLQDLGVDVTMADVEAYAKGDLVGRPHMARALVDKGVVGSIQEAFDEYLGSDGRAYIPKMRLTSEEAIGLVNDAGGIAVMAHPHTVDQDALPGMLDELVEHGLGGVEVIHSKHTPEHRARYAKLAEERGLVQTGGTDFHGDNKPDIALGTGVDGNVRVTYDVVEALKRAVGQ